MTTNFNGDFSADRNIQVWWFGIDDDVDFYGTGDFLESLW